MTYVQINYLITTLNIATTISFIMYIITRAQVLERAIHYEPNKKESLLLGTIFGLLFVVGSLASNIYIYDYQLQTSIIAPLMGSLICGFIPGIIASAIAILYSCTTQTFSTITLMITCACTPFIGGFIRLFLRSKHPFLKGLLAGLICEFTWYAVLLISNQFSLLSIYYVELLVIPTMCVIPVTTGFCCAFIHDVIWGKELRAVESADRILQILRISFQQEHATLNNDFKKSIVENLQQHSALDFICMYDIDDDICTSGEIYNLNQNSCLQENFIEYCKQLLANSYTTQLGYSVLVKKISSQDCVLFSDKRFKACTLVATPVVLNRTHSAVLFSISKGMTAKQSDVLLIAGIGRFVSTLLQQEYADSQKNLLDTTEHLMYKAQMNPHFLFNTLNTINYFTRTDSLVAQNLIADLSRYYQRAFAVKDEILPLSSEIEVCELFFSIQKARFQDRFQITMEIPSSCEEIAFPTFSIQPIVENSFKHGFGQNLGEIWIGVFSEIINGDIVVTIEDNGSGFDDALLLDINTQAFSTATGIGLKNISMRFIYLYGSQYGLRIANTERGAQVVIRAPLNQQLGFNEIENEECAYE